MCDPSSRQSSDLDRSGRTVLIVDDEEIVLNVAKRVVTRLGYSVLLAKGGAKALGMLEEHRDLIGVVILDMGMPRLDGRQTFEKLRLMDPTLKVLLSSGNEVFEGKDDLLSRGAAGFVSKPYDIRGLGDLLADVIS